MIDIDVTDADGNTTTYPVPSSAADTNWAAAQIAFEQALAASVGANAVNEASDSVAGIVSLNAQTLGSGTKTVDGIVISVVQQFVKQVSTDPDPAVAITAFCPTIDVALTSGDVTLAATPTLTAGAEGQEILIINRGAHSITLQDNATLPGSKLRLQATTVALTGGSNVRLRYMGDTWYQTSNIRTV